MFLYWVGTSLCEEIPSRVKTVSNRLGACCNLRTSNQQKKVDRYEQDSQLHLASIENCTTQIDQILYERRDDLVKPNVV